jgi:hypothetical protein
MKLTLTMEMDSAAFGETHDERYDETNRILREVTAKIMADHTEGACVDYNGNTVGHWELEEDGEPEEYEQPRVGGRA